MIESEISSLNQKSDFWSSILETFFSFEYSSNILSTFLANRSFFHINSIISVSNQKIVQYSIWKSSIFTSAFDIEIIHLFREHFENIFIDSHQFISLFSIFDEFNISFSKSHIQDYDIRNLVITSDIFDRIFILSIEFHSFICFENLSEFYLFC